MSEFIKSVCVIVIVVASSVAGVAWIDDGWGPIWKTLRIACPAVALLALALFLKLHLRPDIAYDYLRELGGSYFNRGGLCFLANVTAEGETAYLNIYFQNQYEGSCQGRISVRPGRGFWMKRPKVAPVTVEVDCGSGAFGRASQAIAIPHEIQGKTLRFEVGACAKYPKGRGRRLRFHDGVTLRTTSHFSNSTRILTVAALFTGTLYSSGPATIEFNLPTDVSDQPPNDATTTVEILWQVGEPDGGIGA